MPDAHLWTACHHFLGLGRSTLQVHHLPFAICHLATTKRRQRGDGVSHDRLGPSEFGGVCYDGSVAAAAAAGGVDAQIHLNVPFWTLSIIIY